MKQLIENKKIKNHLDNIKVKCNNLEKNKKELEDVIFQQENKVNELSSSVKKITNIIKIKDIELNNSKIYINNLEDTIKDLNKEFHQIRLKKKKENMSRRFRSNRYNRISKKYIIILYNKNKKYYKIYNEKNYKETIILLYCNYNKIDISYEIFHEGKKIDIINHYNLIKIKKNSFK